jgi:hypothetical protein
MKKGILVKGINGKFILLLPFMYLGHLITWRSIQVLTRTSLDGLDGKGNAKDKTKGNDKGKSSGERDDIVTTTTGRSQNDKNNKLREAIICAIIENKVPSSYYKTTIWRDMKQTVDGFLYQLAPNSGYTSVECSHTAGRTNNYDFLLTFTGLDGVKKEHKVEFKFNASKISDTPQFVSPMRPSQYLSSSYEEFFYDNYMSKMVGDLVSLPNREEWLKQIHNNSPPCIKHIQDKYYAGCSSSSQFTNAPDDIAFYNLCKQLSKESISKFIAENELDIVKLSCYLRESQDGKVYMLFQPAGSGAATITLQTVDPAHYNITSYVKNPKNARYECVSETGQKINILLRWKNGNGVAFPAFQIS